MPGPPLNLGEASELIATTSFAPPRRDSALHEARQTPDGGLSRKIAAMSAIEIARSPQ
jgi:hypothetical protein